MNVTSLAPWYYAWACSVPIIVVNVVIHIAGLAAIHSKVAPILSASGAYGRLTARFAAATSLVVVALTGLHMVEGVVWASSYRMVGAISSERIAMLYSIEAMTSYGHAPVYLPVHWQMMGALEALNGMILFGLTTAFLFAFLWFTPLFFRRT
jgi:hypothetical protein